MGNSFISTDFRNKVITIVRSILPISSYLSINANAKPWKTIIPQLYMYTEFQPPQYLKWFDNVQNTIHFENSGSSYGLFFYTFGEAYATDRENLFFTLQLPQDWDGLSLKPIVHWIASIDEQNTTCGWDIEYSWVNVGEIYPYTTIISSDGKPYYSDESFDVDIIKDKHYMSYFDTLVTTSSNNKKGSILIGRLTKSYGKTNTQLGYAGLLSLSFAYQIESLGSNTIYQ